MNERPRVDIDAYLARIGHSGSREPTSGTLLALHRQHMLSVPFENLDIPLGRRITLHPDALWQKVVVNRRGGFCYELNTLFGRLLQAMGYRVDYLSARVWKGTGWGPDKDHMTLRVEADGKDWLVDVGFGDSFLEPLLLEPGVVQEAGFTSFRLLNEARDWIMQARNASGEWDAGYLFTLEAHPPESFATMCEYQQTSPEATFTQRVVCSRATAAGRVSVTRDRVIVTSGGTRREAPLANAAAFRLALAEHQGIDLSEQETEVIIKRVAM